MGSMPRISTQALSNTASVGSLAVGSELDSFGPSRAVIQDFGLSLSVGEKVVGAAVKRWLGSLELSPN
jgi:hypothetical protein